MTLDQVNEALLNMYGTSLTGKQRFRVVERDTTIEKRKGVFEDWHGDIFIRRVTGVRPVLKYQFADPGSYVLERYVAEPFGGVWPAMPALPDIVDWDGYEPFYVFDAAVVKVRGIPPFRAVHFIIQTNLFKKDLKKSLKTMHEESEAKVEKEKAEFLAMLDDANPWIANALHEGEAVTVPDIKKDIH